MMNRAVVIGRLTRDVQLAYTPQGTAYARISVAVNRAYRDKEGERGADFIGCTLWGKLAENAALYCRRGSLIGITGRIQTSRYNNAAGQRVYRTEVVAESVSYLDRKREADAAPVLS